MQRYGGCGFWGLIYADIELINGDDLAMVRHNNEIMKEANYEVRSIMYNDKERDAAQLRLNVPRNRLYTSLIREYFKNTLERDQS